MKWLNPGITMHKGQLKATDGKDVGLLATLGEDGFLLIWDVKNLDKTIKNDISNYIRPSMRVEVFKMDTIQRISGTDLAVKITPELPLVYLSNDEGQVYEVNCNVKNTQENLTNNVKFTYNAKQFRPVIAMLFSPFFEDIFLTVHDFYFSLWSVGFKKPIFTSPSLKSTYYTCAKFSDSRPSVIYLTRTNGKIDIWDFLDESHKPSIKEMFIKDEITAFELFTYIPRSESYSEEKVTAKKIHYFVIGYQNGQLTMMEIPSLFTDKATDEEKTMRELLDNFKERSGYLDERYALLDEEYSRPKQTVEDLEINRGEEPEIYQSDLKEEEEQYNEKKVYWLKDLGLLSQEELEALEEKENENNENK